MCLLNDFNEVAVTKFMSRVHSPGSGRGKGGSAASQW